MPISEHYKTCEICNYGGHTCPGCGDDIQHEKDNVQGVCEKCQGEVDRGER